MAPEFLAYFAPPPAALNGEILPVNIIGELQCLFLNGIQHIMSQPTIQSL